MDLSGLTQLNIRLFPIIVVHRIDPIQWWLNRILSSCRGRKTTWRPSDKFQIGEISWAKGWMDQGLYACIIWGVGGFKTAKRGDYLKKWLWLSDDPAFSVMLKHIYLNLRFFSWMVIDRQKGCGRSTESWSSQPAIGAWWGILENKLPQTNYHDMENPWLLGSFWSYSHHFIVIIVASAIVISIISITILVSFSHFLFLLPLPLPFFSF